MMSSRPVLSRRGIFVTATLFAVLAAVALALVSSRSSKADDGQARVTDRFAVLGSGESPGVAVVDPDDMNSATSRAKLRDATPSNPVVFKDGPVDTSRIRRSDSARNSRGVVGGSNVRGTWVAPSTTGGVCVLVTAGGDETVAGTCSRPGAIDKGSTVTIFGNGSNDVAVGETIFAGTVPDGVTSVEIDLATGTTTTVPVVENTFTFDTAVAVARYRFVTADGTSDSTPVAGAPNA
jgi:hypothetical protein